MGPWFVGLLGTCACCDARRFTIFNQIKSWISCGIFLHFICRLNKLSKWNVNWSYLSTSFSLELVISLYSTILIWWFVAARVDVNSCFGFLNVLPAHQVILVKILSYIDQIVSLVQTIDINDLYAQLFRDFISRFSIESNTLTDWKIRADWAFKLVFNNEINVKIEFNSIEVSIRFGILWWWWSNPWEYNCQVTLSVVWLNN